MIPDTTQGNKIDQKLFYPAFVVMEFITHQIMITIRLEHDGNTGQGGNNGVDKNHRCAALPVKPGDAMGSCLHNRRHQA